MDLWGRISRIGVRWHRAAASASLQPQHPPRVAAAPKGPGYHPGGPGCHPGGPPGCHPRAGRAPWCKHGWGKSPLEHHGGGRRWEMQGEVLSTQGCCPDGRGWGFWVLRGGGGRSGSGGVSTAAPLLRSIRLARCMPCPSVWMPPWGPWLGIQPGCHPNLGTAEPGRVQDHARVPLSVTRSPVSLTARCHPLSRNGPGPGTAGPSLPSTLPWQNGSRPLAPHRPRCTLGQALGTGGPARETSPGLGWEVGTGGSDAWDPAVGMTVTPPIQLCRYDGDPWVPAVGVTVVPGT